MKIKLIDGSGIVDLKYLYEDVDRHGRVRIYYRRKGQLKRALTAQLGSHEFLEQYKQAHAGVMVERTQTDRPKRERAKVDSLRYLVEQYYGSAEFRRLAESTQHVRRMILDGVCEESLNASDPASLSLGNARFSLMQPLHVRRCRDRKANTPEAANSRVKALRQVFKWSVDAGLANRNPANDVPYLHGGGQGFHAWTVGEVRQFEQRHPIGTKARLALALLLLTGQRRSDIVLFGKQHIREARHFAPALHNVHPGRWLQFTQQKNRGRAPVSLTIPIVSELEEIIAQSPCGTLNFLVTAFGRPFKPAGFGNWFRARCDEAGLHHCSAHGLRKAGATIAVENGATERQLMAIFGWKTSKQAVHYTRSADQKALAAGAMTLLSPGRK